MEIVIFWLTAGSRLRNYFLLHSMIWKRRIQSIQYQHDIAFYFDFMNTIYIVAINETMYLLCSYEYLISLPLKMLRSNYILLVLPHRDGWTIQFTNWHICYWKWPTHDTQRWIKLDSIKIFWSFNGYIYRKCISDEDKGWLSKVKPKVNLLYDFVFLFITIIVVSGEITTFSMR